MADDKPIPASASNDVPPGIRNLDDSTPPASLIDGGAGGGGGGGPPPPGTAIGVQPYSLDDIRKKIAYFLLWIMVGVIAVVVLVSLVFSARCWVDSTTCPAANTALGILIGSISPIFTAMVGLVGSVVGFYFGSKQS